MSAFDSHVRSLWSGRAETYAATFGRMCAGAAVDLLDAAGVSEGTRVLDVGTGPGTVGRLALQRGAKVSAVDAEPSMVALARNVLPDVRLGVLPDLPFPDAAFDVAVANFVVQHVGDPAAAVAGMARTVRPAGTVAVTIWPASAPVSALFMEAFAAAGVEADAPRIDAGLDFARDEAGLAGLLEAAGLEAVSVRTLSWEHRVDPEVWWGGAAGGIGSAGHVLAEQDAPTVERIHAAYGELVSRDADGLMTLTPTALLASGTHPSR